MLISSVIEDLLKRTFVQYLIVFTHCYLSCSDCIKMNGKCLSSATSDWSVSVPQLSNILAVSARHPAGGRVQLRRGAAGCSLLCWITGWEGVGTERVTTNLRGNAARQGEGLSVVQHRTGDEIAAQTQSEAPALWVIALENHWMSGQIAQ